MDLQQSTATNFQKFALVLAQSGHPPVLMMHVSSRVCWAMERTSGIPASHFFRSPADDSLSSRDAEVAVERKLVGK